METNGVFSPTLSEIDKYFIHPRREIHCYVLFVCQCDIYTITSYTNCLMNVNHHPKKENNKIT